MSPRQMTETAYMAASTGLLWVAIYYLPIGDALFRLAIPLPLVLLQLRHGGRTALEGVAVTVLLLTVLLQLSMVSANLIVRSCAVRCSL